MKRQLYYILLSLAAEDRHGAGVVRDVLELTDGELKLWPATLYGSLLTNDVNLTVGGSVLVNYSSQALGLANQASGGMALPAPVQLASLIDCSQAVAGAAGCP